MNLNLWCSMERKIFTYKKKTPLIKKDVFIAEGSKIIGNVEIDAGSSVWYNCVIRGDVEYIKIGKNTNVQDGTVIHVSGNVGNVREGAPVTVVVSGPQGNLVKVDQLSVKSNGDYMMKIDTSSDLEPQGVYV